MLPYLSENCPFPPANNALPEPNGLLAAGADLTPDRLIQAYNQGIFPWYSPGEPILWWSPDPRTVFFVDRFKVHKSVKKTLKKLKLKVTLNQAFEDVVAHCAMPRSDDSGTWITAEMQHAYCQLRNRGIAQSVEVWQQDKLVGGIYGVASGVVFCGESMFSGVSNGSKIALSFLSIYLKNNHFNLIDCQIENPHLMKLGATNITRNRYLELLKLPLHHQSGASLWLPQELSRDLLFEQSKKTTEALKPLKGSHHV